MDYSSPFTLTLTSRRRSQRRRVLFLLRVGCGEFRTSFHNYCKTLTVLCRDTRNLQGGHRW